jgi:hypothetical protein
MFILSQFWDQRAKVIELRAIFVENLIKLKIDFFHKNFEMKPILIGIILGWVTLQKL